MKSTNIITFQNYDHGKKSAFKNHKSVLFFIISDINEEASTRPVPLLCSFVIIRQ